jgi:hypothetical protein
MSGFALNFQDLFEMDVTPEGSSTFARLGAGISSVTPGLNDNVDQTPYLDGNGFGSSDVIGKQLIYSVTGHRVVGDSVQDFVAGKRFSLGDDLKTNFRAYDSDGNLVTGACTLANIVIGGGDAQGKKDISFEIHINGQPTDTPASAAPALSVVVAGGAVAGTTSFTATPGSGNTLAYKLTAAALAPNENSWPGNLVDYTSGNDIVAAVDQYLNMFELDANYRVVNFSTQQLAAGDIT